MTHETSENPPSAGKNNVPVARRAGRRIHTHNAMALVAVMLVLMLILAASLIGFAKINGPSGDVGTTTNNMMRMSKRRLSVMNAETLADTGARAAIQWISELSGPPLNSTAFTPVEHTPNEFFYDSGRSDSGKWTVVNFPNKLDSKEGQFKVRFYPHSDNATAAQRAFLVESIGTVNGISRVVRADIKQKNFAQYAYFTDNVGTGSWIAGVTSFNGPVHINNSNGADINILWDSLGSPTTSRIFTWDGDNSFSMWRGDSDANIAKLKWRKDGNTSAVTPPSSDPNWQNVLTPKTNKDANGNVISTETRTGPQLVKDKIEMPKNSYDQRDAAMGGYAVSNYDSKGNGVFVPSSGGADGTSGVPTGGIVIKGQVEDMVMEAAGTGNRDQLIHVYQDYGNTKYTIRMNADKTTTVKKFIRTGVTPFVEVLDTNYPKSFAGSATNGVIYSYDDIGNWSSGDGTGGLSGTVANGSADGTSLNKLTICTRIEGTPGGGLQKTINIDGNILYANAAKDTKVAQPDSGILGIVAGYIKIVPKARVYEPTVTGFQNYTVSTGVAYAHDAVLDNLSVHSTLMSFNTIKIDSHTSRPKGDFRLLGGYIAQIGSSFGTVRGGTDPATSLDVMTGFQRNLNYDKRVANQPPPYFPGTGQAYEIVSYQRLLSPLQP